MEEIEKRKLDLIERYFEEIIKPMELNPESNEHAKVITKYLLRKGLTEDLSFSVMIGALKRAEVYISSFEPSIPSKFR